MLTVNANIFHYVFRIAWSSRSTEQTRATDKLVGKCQVEAFHITKTQHSDMENLIFQKAMLSKKNIISIRAPTLDYLQLLSPKTLKIQNIY